MDTACSVGEHFLLREPLPPPPPPPNRQNPLSLKYLSAEIWDTLKAVAESRLDDGNSFAILDAAGIRVNRNDLSSVYDERGDDLLLLLPPYANNPISQLFPSLDLILPLK